MTPAPTQRPGRSSARWAALSIVLALAGCEPGGPASGDLLVSISPANPTSADPLTAVITDADGAPATLGDQIIAWRVDGVAVETTGATLPATETNRGEVWEAALVEGSATVVSSPVTIVNAVPSINEVQLTPTEPASDEAIEALVGGWVDADADEPTYRYAWTVNGSPAGDDASSLPAGSAVRGDEVTVQVTPLDAFSEGDPVTATAVTVANGVPFAPVVSIEPSEPQAGLDPLVCAVDGSAPADPDGDACTYVISWSLDGAPWPDPNGPDIVETTTIAGDTVPGGQTATGQTWRCEVVANDGEADSAPGEASVYLAAGPMPDFDLTDVNATSPTSGLDVSPRDYLQKVSGWYFGHAT